MSFHQSRSDRSETQYRKSGRSAGSNQQRTSSGSYGKGSGGGPAPSPSISSSLSLSSNRSYKKSHNAQGGQSRVNVPTVNSTDASSNDSASRNAQNGAPLQPQLPGTYDALVGSGAAKHVESATTQSGTRAVPKAPISQPSSMNSDRTGPGNQSKGQGDASKEFHFQFGSIGMQIPARTSSAPPNLDEQKRDQAHHDAYRSVPIPNLPTQSVPKQQLLRKDASANAQSSTGEVQQVTKPKKEVQVSHAPTSNQTQKPSVLPMPMASMQMTFRQQQVSMQFGGHSPQMQSQNVTGTSLQLPLPIALPMGSSQQHLFVPGLQPHPMQPQGIMHQGQGLNFTAQMGPPQLGNMGIGITSQYPQQQGGQYAGPRKTIVKITDPETHKEVKLDERMDTHMDCGVSAPRSHTNIPQSQPIQTFSPAHQINCYSSSFNHGSMYFSTPGSLPLMSSQRTPNSQAPRYNYTVGQGPPNVSFINPTTIGSLPVSKTGILMPTVMEPPNSDHSRDVHNIIYSAPSGTVQVTVKPAKLSVGEKVSDSSLSVVSPTVGKGGLSKPSRLSGEGSGSSVSTSLLATTKQSLAVSPTASTDNLTTNSVSSCSTAPSEEPAPVATNVEGRTRESLSRSNSNKDHQKKPARKEQIHSQQEVGVSTSTSSLVLRASEHGISFSSKVSDSVKTKTNPIRTITSEVLSEVTRELVSNVEAPESKAEISSAANSDNSLDAVQNANMKFGEPSSCESFMAERAEETLSERSKQDSNSLDISPEPLTSKSADLDDQTQQESVLKTAAASNEVSMVATAEEKLDEPASYCTEAGTGRVSDNMSLSGAMGSTDVESLHGNMISTVDTLSSRRSVIDEDSAHPSTTETSEEMMRNERESLENRGTGLVSVPVSGFKDKPVLELTKSKSTTSKGKKKKKEILQKADAAGTTSDLYMAYKGPEEKREVGIPSETADNSSTIINLKQLSVDAVASEKIVQIKMEPDDWEDAADISTPKLEPSGVGEQSLRLLVQNEDNGDGNLGKKYSRDFLLKFSEYCTDLPEGFEIASDIAEVMMGANIGVSHLVDCDSYPGPGRTMDRLTGGPRMDRRGSVIVDDDRWGRLTGPSLVRDMHLDVGYGGNAGFRPGQGGNYGVLRNPRAQMPVQYAGGILSGPMQSMGPQGGMQRNSPDADRWQRATNFQQKGLIPSPTPLQVMHKAEKKYEVGKVTDEEEAKQRQLKAILNKLTPQNFEKLFEQVKGVNIDNAITLTGVISQIFDKALMEPTFCEMYANFCFHLAGELPDFCEDNEKITFKRLLLNKCQEEFERGEREQEEANKADKEGEIKQSDEEREEKRIKARRRMLGNIRLIGELYKKKMLTERIMHDCIKKLLGQYESPDEEDVEALCKLMSTIGEMIDHPKAKDHMDAYFDRMVKLSHNLKLSSRVRFMLKDAIELRNNKWQQRRKVEGPKKIEEVHRDAAQERQAQTSRLSRGSSMNSSSRRAPTDFGPRSAMLSSPTAQMGSFRGLPSQSRGYGVQDVRIDDRQSYESRVLAPLPQRPIGDDSITLGPQGGLARRMSSVGEPRIMTAGLNGFSSLSERTAYGSREDLMPRYHPNRFAGPTTFDQVSAREHNMNYANRDARTPDRSFERPLATSLPTLGQGQASTENAPSEVQPEECLRDMSLSTIKEFYSARDEKEVALCIKDLNSPSFHPSMVSLWITDSFERKDTEQDLLAKLLVNLSKSQDGMLSPVQLVKGFEYVLCNLEDAVNDAPKAAEFLGHIFGKVILENVIPLRDIGQLLYEGGEKPGRLLQIGLAGDVLGSILESIKSDKGEAVLNKIRMSSSLQLEDFRHPDPNRSKILEKFI